MIHINRSTNSQSKTQPLEEKKASPKQNKKTGMEINQTKRPVETGQQYDQKKRRPIEKTELEAIDGTDESLKNMKETNGDGRTLSSTCPINLLPYIIHILNGSAPAQKRSRKKNGPANLNRPTGSYCHPFTGLAAGRVA